MRSKCTENKKKKVWHDTKPFRVYLLKINNRNTEQGVKYVRVVLVSLLLTLKM